MSRLSRRVALIAALTCTPAVSLTLVAPSGAQAANVPVQVTLTDANLHQAALSPEPDLSFSHQPLARGVRVLTVDDQVQEQPIVGFGAAMTDTSAWLIHDFLSPGRRRQLLTQLFGPTGLNLDFDRVPIGGSDFTAGSSPYSYDDLPAGQSDPTLADFSIAHDLPYIVPVLQQMLKVNPAIDLISTEWSPPAWMKSNDAADDLNGAGTLLATDYPVLAQYLVRFIQAYAAAGIPIWAITPQNEPGTEPSFPSLDITPADEAQFIAADLAPAFAAAGISTRIYGGDIGPGSPAYATAAQEDPAAASALSGEAWHCYGGQQGISAFHAVFPEVQELMTECSPGVIPYSAGEAAIDAMDNWASSADLWNVALDPRGGPVQPPNQGCLGCTGLVTINEATGAVRYTASYYQLGQLSKFVQRGAVRIATPRWVSDTGAGSTYAVTSGLDNVAFLNPDGTRVLVADDHSAVPITFGVGWDGQQFSYTLQPGATVTFRWHGTATDRAVDAVGSCFNAGVRYVPQGGGVVALPDCGA